jgi:hypothetical protein
MGLWRKDSSSHTRLGTSTNWSVKPSECAAASVCRLLVLEAAIQDPGLSKMLAALFNDNNVNHSATLEPEIMRLNALNV